VRIPLTPVQQAQHAHPEDGQYRWFLASSLALALGGGFAVALLLPFARLYDWEWAAGVRWAALAQAHGQLQLIGFAGLFINGMAFRLMPRFSGRPLAFARAAPWLIPLVACSLALRMFAQPWSAGAGRDAALVLSATLYLVAAALFAAIIVRTLVHPDSRAEATGIFFVLGAIGNAVAAALNFVALDPVIRDDLWTAPALRQNALLAVQLFGFVMMFIGGVGLRAVPTLTGRPRPDAGARIAAAAMAVGVVMYAGAMLSVEYDVATELRWRWSDAGMLVIAVAIAAVAVMSGALHIGRSRVAAASQTQFWLVRSAFAWLALTAVVMAWYAGRAIYHGDTFDTWELDTVRHMLALGVITMMIVGIAMLVVPEYAGRRLQHPDEGPIVWAMVLALNAAAVLRTWPPSEAAEWLDDSRYWPIAIGGLLAIAVVLVFAAMFAQSYAEQRRPGWALPGRRRA
jgi:hypothetical protein